MTPIKVSEKVFIVGASGSTTINVDISFEFPPSTFSPGMAMIVTRELQNVVQRIVETARKLK